MGATRTNRAYWIISAVFCAVVIAAGLFVIAGRDDGSNASAAQQMICRSAGTGLQGAQSVARFGGPDSATGASLASSADRLLVITQGLVDDAGDSELAGLVADIDSGSDQGGWHRLKDWCDSHGLNTTVPSPG